MTSSPPSWRPNSVRGFTLVELLLTLGLIVALATVIVVAIPALNRSAALDECVNRFVTTLRLARAEAANRGRCLRLAFEPESGRPMMLCEIDPLEAPGQFAPYAGAWAEQVPAEMVRATEAALTGSSAYRMLSTAEAESDALPELQFYPDGSSDSGRWVLASADPRDTRVAIVTLDGLTGTVQQSILTASQYEESQ
jgi:type II secretory pathway pseudopilin PulG